MIPPDADLESCKHLAKKWRFVNQMELVSFAILVSHAFSMLWQLTPGCSLSRNLMGSFDGLAFWNNSPNISTLFQDVLPYRNFRNWLAGIVELVVAFVFRALGLWWCVWIIHSWRWSFDHHVLLHVACIPITADWATESDQPSVNLFAVSSTLLQGFLLRRTILKPSSYTDKNSCDCRWKYKHSHLSTFS